MPDDLRTRIAAAIEADAEKPPHLRVGVIDAMLSIVQPELDRLAVDQFASSPNWLAAERDSWRMLADSANGRAKRAEAERDRYRSAWQSARQRAARAAQHVDELQDKVISFDDNGKCCCSFEGPGDICMVHSPTVQRLAAKVEALETGYDQVAADALAHRLCHMTEGGLIRRAEKAEAELADWRAAAYRATAERDEARASIGPVGRATPDPRHTGAESAGRQAGLRIPCTGPLPALPHAPHAWEPQPGMTPVWCPGTTIPTEES